MMEVVVEDRHQYHHHQHKRGLFGYLVKKIKRKEEHEAEENHEKSKSHCQQEEDYVKLANDLTETVWQIHQTESGWKLEKGDNSADGMVHSTYCKKVKRKIYRLQGELDIKAKFLWDECADRLEDNPTWNPTLLETRVLHPINQNTDIAYTVAAGAAGGLVSARDFVNIRQWTEIEGHYLSLVSHTTFSGMPHQKKYVRGENGPGGFIFVPIPNEPNKCQFIWYMNTNLKGWLPQHAIDFGLTGVMFDYLKNLRMHIEDLKTKGLS